MSNSVQPHRWKPTRLPRPGILQACNPMNCSPPGSSVHDILQARKLEGEPFPYPGDLLDPGIKPGSPASRQMLYHLSHQGNPDSTHGYHQMVNTETKLIIFFAAKDGGAIYNQQKQDRELTVAQIMNSLLPNSDLPRDLPAQGPRRFIE